MQFTRETIDPIITILITLNTEANKPNTTLYEFAKRADAIVFILNNIEKNLGKEYMLFIFMKTSEILNKPLGPLQIEFVKKMVYYGCPIENVVNIQFNTHIC
jgi:hypothetical protein